MSHILDRPLRQGASSRFEDDAFKTHPACDFLWSEAEYDRQKKVGRFRRRALNRAVSLAFRKKARPNRRLQLANPTTDTSGITPLTGHDADSPKSKQMTHNRTLRAARRELWYPPSNAMGRFCEAADPQMALAARAERPRVLAGLHDSTKWPGIPTS